MLNRIEIIGRLGKDPESKYTPSGKQVVTFTVATDDGYGDKKVTMWHRVVTWEKQAAVCEKYLGKGKLVYVSGRLSHRSYDDKDGIKRDLYEIVAREVKLLSPVDKSSAKSDNYPGGNDRDVPAPVSDDDIPF
jgi:single-strand DNA-binding protein